MKNTLFSIAILFVTWAVIVIVVKYQNLAALMFLLIGIYVLLARLIVNEQEKSEEMMGRLNKKVSKSKEAVYKKRLQQLDKIKV